MQPYRLLTLGLTAIVAALLTFASSGPAHAGALAAQGAGGVNKAITHVSDANVVKVAKRRGSRFRRVGKFRRSGALRRPGSVRRHGGFRRHAGLKRHRGYRRHGGFKRHRGHRRFGHRRHRRSSLIISYAHPYPYGYGSSYFGYGYGYPYYYADPYHPPAAYVTPRYRRSARRASYRRSCRPFGVGTRQWTRCCSRKYRSFNPRTGKYLSYSGRYRTCR
ncbi:MAG: hypothetical protein HKN11_02865 [Rhizobiales bacterium]|nr:hypothetical protein [Hyphomicrobiales bacterium]